MQTDEQEQAGAGGGLRGRSLLAFARARSLLGVLPIVVFLGLRQVFMLEVAILGGFSASVAVFVLNRGHAGPILGLSTFTLIIAGVASVAALWAGDERVYFASDPMWDFGIAAILLGSLALRRPLTAALAYELVPVLRDTLHRGHAVFYITTLMALGMYVVHGALRVALLLRSGSIEEYLLLSRAMQWPTVVLLVLVAGWMIKRSAERSGARLAWGEG